jgi:hypothetical protein
MVLLSSKKSASPVAARLTNEAGVGGDLNFLA